MVAVKIADKDLVEIVERDRQGGQALERTAADVENELVAIAKFHEEAGSGLFGARTWHAGSAGRHPHLVRREGLGAGKIDITVGKRFDRRECLGVLAWIGFCMRCSGPDKRVDGSTESAQPIVRRKDPGAHERARANQCQTETKLGKSAHLNLLPGPEDVRRWCLRHIGGSTIRNSSK